ncbi:hypothetical protein [Devosia nitrariae]|uniref:Uncharacterized protein n=1 Tax=Devosia nitrariae TaxID=2071872 RepID=A0ABQ5W7L3_9HYPH|nr:hypothetical protein [Devosia nitrariae]GLQ55935.1 hypothetical protein GCM10010862_31940 [Devosia nitrariae]
MTRNGFYLIIAALVAVIAVLGIYIYQQETRPGVEIRLDEQGLSVDGNG